MIKQANVVAQSNGIETRNFAFFSQKDGLSNYNIHKILQDKNRFLWIATQGGLNRFDGKEFIVFNKGIETKRALFSNDIRELVYDSLKGIVWAVCNEGGINGIDVNTACVRYSIPYNDYDDDFAWRICAKAMDNKIYIGTSSGLDIFNTRSLCFEPLSLYRLSAPNDQPKIDVRLIDSDEYGNIWLGVKNKGLMIFDPARKKIIKSIPFKMSGKIKDETVFWPLCGVFSKDNTYWLGTRNGLFKISYNKNYEISFIPLRQTGLERLRKQEISHLCFNSLGLMICSNSLLAYNPTQNKILKLLPSGSEDQKWLSDLTCCFEDDEKNLWLGCKQGLGQMKNSKIVFTHVRNTELVGNKLGHLYAVCPISSTQVLAGAKDGLYLVENGNSMKQLVKNRLVQNIFKLTKDDIVISGNEGIQLFSHARIIPIEKKYPEFLPYRKWQFNSRIVFDDSLILIGTESNAGILKWNIKKHTILQIQEAVLKEEIGLISNTINTVFLNKKNEAIVVSDYGLTILNKRNSNTKKIAFSQKETLKPLGIFMDMAETAGYYWLGTYGEGLIKLDKNYKLLKIFGLNDGISNTQVYKIFNYKDSLLLLTSNNGISIFDVYHETFKKYFEEDGLQNNTFEEACGDQWGDIFYAGGVEGFVTIRPDAIRPASIIPRLILTNISFRTSTNVLVDTADFTINSIPIPNDVLQTDVSFSGTYFSNPSKVQYAYRIKERDTSWIKHGYRNLISITGLAPGTYTLEVKALNEDGYWSPVKQLKLLFEPKWYQTWLFNISLIFAVAGLLCCLYIYRINQLNKQQEIRIDIARDLHDDIGSSLNTAKIFTHLAKKEQGNQPYLEQVENSLTQAITGMRDIIWVLDDSQDTAFGLMERIKKFTLPILHANDIQLETKVESDSHTMLSKTEKRNLLLIAKEFINNSLKYSDCRNVKVYIRQAKGKKSLLLSDDGKGFDTELQTDGNGLKNIQIRAKQIHYLVNIVSRPGNGTSLQLLKE